jgi:hypothetical protein
MPAKAGGRLFCVFSDEMDAAVASEWLDQVREHFFEAKGVQIEVFARIITREADMRQIQPSVGSNQRNAKSLVRQLLGKPGRDISFSLSVNATDGNQAGPALLVEWHVEDRGHKCRSVFCDFHPQTMISSVRLLFV